MNITEKLGKARKSIVRTVVNDIPTHLINAGYNTYSNAYKGQLSLGLPVAPELIVSQEQIAINAIGKLALTMYHAIIKITKDIIPRANIKNILKEEFRQGNIHLTENVILLEKTELDSILNNLNIDKQLFPELHEEAFKRYILTQSLKKSRQPAYFESQIDEKENNGRGDYEIVYYQDFTREGKEIKFQRLVSMEGVTAGDNNPSIILVPGFANNSRCFNISNHYSIAKDLADKNNWVYLFDPRGMGVNSGLHDPYYTVDTLIDHDLPTVQNFIYKRSCGKPSILLGHSMGGIISENMVLNWGLRLGFNKIKIDEKKKKILDSILVSEEKAKQSLSMVKGIISLGSPKCFDKKSHVFFPSALWLNHFSRVFKLSEVPIRQASKIMTQTPVLKAFTRFIYNNNIGDLNFLISPENHKNDKYFIERYFKNATESIPLGLGFQFLKAVYDGQGFKRMDKTSLNYSNHFSFFPKNIPLFHFWGAKDNLASLKSMKYSKFYPHKIKKVYHLEKAEDLKKIEILSEPGQVIDFVIEGANHLDLLYGKKAKELVHPVIEKIIDATWSDQSYNRHGRVVMLRLKDLGIVGRTYRNINRYRQILTILFKYGFGNIIDVLKIDQYLEIGLKMISKTRQERVEKLSPAQRVRLLFEELGPTFIKFGQILSTRPDLIPVHYIYELEKLQDNVPAFSFKEVQQIISDEFGQDKNPFEFIEAKPLASASLGQVHLAKLKNKKNVAIKIQRPGIRKLIKIDLEIMHHMATLMERHIEDLSFFHPIRIVDEFASSLERELDYTLEASNMERVARQFLFDENIYIPKVFLDQSTSTVLTMEYIHGIKISKIDELDDQGMDRKLLTLHGADMVLIQVFEYGFFHADLHPGNLFALPGNVLCPVDYGMMGFIDLKARHSFIDLIASVVTRNSAQACRFLLELTEYDEEPDMRILERDIANFIGQYLTKALKHINMGRLLQDLLNIVVKHKLRLYPDTFLMMKSFAALEGVAHILDPDFDMAGHAAPFIKKIKMARISPKKISEDLGRVTLESLEFLQEAPKESLTIIRQIRKGKFSLGFNIQKLDKILAAHGNAYTKLSFSIIIAALITGSSLLLSFKAAPRMFGVSLPGIIGFVLSIFLVLWLFSRTKK